MSGLLWLPLLGSQNVAASGACVLLATHLKVLHVALDSSLALLQKQWSLTARQVPELALHVIPSAACIAALS